MISLFFALSFFRNRLPTVLGRALGVYELQKWVSRFSPLNSFFAFNLNADPEGQKAAVCALKQRGSTSVEASITGLSGSKGVQRPIKSNLGLRRNNCPIRHCILLWQDGRQLPELLSCPLPLGYGKVPEPRPGKGLQVRSRS